MKARLLYILAEGLHYRFSDDKVIVTVNPLALLHSLTDQDLHLVTETELDRTRLSLLQ